MKLNYKALALTFSIMFGILTLVFTIWYTMTGYASEIIQIIVSIYGNIFELSYNPLAKYIVNLKNNILNIIILTIFSFFDGLLIGLSIAFLYNIFLPKERHKK